MHTHDFFYNLTKTPMANASRVCCGQGMEKIVCKILLTNYYRTIKIFEDDLINLYTKERDLFMKKWIFGFLILLFVSPMTTYAEESAIGYDFIEFEEFSTLYDFAIFEDFTIYDGVYIPQEMEPVTFITTATLNLRSAPNRYSGRVSLVQAGRMVQVTDFRNGEWFAVSHNGNTGFMYANYLLEIPALGSGSANVELVEWSVARNIMTIGTPATIVDVRTGIIYQVKSFSNGRHADVEPITPEDTAAMLRAFGGRWSWDTRPVLVIINGRVLAASINGMPHAGSTNSGNNMNGHVCLHFLGSRTHNGSTFHERSHQASVREAYNSASRR